MTHKPGWKNGFIWETRHGDELVAAFDFEVLTNSGYVKSYGLHHNRYDTWKLSCPFYNALCKAMAGAV